MLNSPNGRVAWEEVTKGVNLPAESRTRWYSKYQCYVVLLENWGSIRRLLLHMAHAPHVKKARKSLATQLDFVLEDALSIMSDGNIIDVPLTGEQLSRLELVTMVEAAQTLVWFCYSLEGDGFLFPFANRMQSMVTQALRNFTAGHHPRLTAVAESIATEVLESHPQLGVPRALLLQACRDYGRVRVEPVRLYWRTNVIEAERFKASWAIAKASEIICPDILHRSYLPLERRAQLVAKLYAIAADPQCAGLRLSGGVDVPRLVDEIPALVLEVSHDNLPHNHPPLPSILQLGVHPGDGDGVTVVQAADALRDWWRARVKAKSIPHWCALAGRFMTLTPSSAMAERAFSLIQALVDDRQETMLTDGQELGVKTRYNTLRRSAERSLVET